MTPYFKVLLRVISQKNQKNFIENSHQICYIPSMDQDRIDYIVEELEQYLPTSAQVLLQELMEGLRKTPAVPENDLKENLLNDSIGSKYATKYTPRKNYGGKDYYSQKEMIHDWEHNSGYSALSKAYHEKTTKKS